MRMADLECSTLQPRCKVYRQARGQGSYISYTRDAIHGLDETKRFGAIWLSLQVKQQRVDKTSLPDHLPMFTHRLIDYLADGGTKIGNNGILEKFYFCLTTFNKRAFYNSSNALC